MASEHQTWLENNGDATFALNWNIKKNARVWEIGGFEGRWAAQMAEKFAAQITIFEPQGWAVERLQKRFKDNSNVEIRPYGLWVMDANLPLYHYETDGASLLNAGVHSQVCEFRDAFQEFEEDIDVGLLNVEGSEFILIPYLLGYDLMKKFKYFWCQFHTFVPESTLKKEVIYAGMARTHDVLWDFYPSAVAWKRR